MLATAAAIAVAAMSVGCGASPAYEPEPRMPGGYVPGTTEPPTSDELARTNVNAQANGEVALGADANEYSDTDPSALTEFKPALEGHGQWVDDSTYGTVWVPAESEVGTDFVPYTTSGHWTYDDSTNYVWVSDYSWGWAPFHYGRWVHATRHGWAWIPGRTYSGAWVTWRTGGPDYEYVGWAPAGPEWYWYGGYALGWNFGWSPYYSYCHHDYLYDGYVGQHVVRGDDPRGRDYEAHTRPYTAAQPTVGGNGRVAANPSVGAGGRVAASPRVGPRPSELGIKADNVVRPPIGHPGLGRAQALASPATAVAAGAAPPAQVAQVTRGAQTAGRRPFDHNSVASDASGADRRGFAGRGPVTSRVDAVARAPQVQGVSPVPPHAYPMANGNGATATRGFSDQPRQSTPSYRSAPSMGASPPSTFRSSPSAPSSFSSPSQPTFHAAPSQSQPTFHAAPSQPTFHSSPSVSQPTFHSSPSAPAAHYSPPSVSRPSSPSRSTSAPAVKRR